MLFVFSDHSDSNGNGKTTDNTESVDMDLSDDDEAAKAQFKGEFYNDFFLSLFSYFYHFFVPLIGKKVN